MLENFDFEEDGNPGENSGPSPEEILRNQAAKLPPLENFLRDNTTIPPQELAHTDSALKNIPRENNLSNILNDAKPYEQKIGRFEESEFLIEEYFHKHFDRYNPNNLSPRDLLKEFENSREINYLKQDEAEIIPDNDWDKILGDDWKSEDDLSEENEEEFNFDEEPVDESILDKEIDSILNEAVDYSKKTPDAIPPEEDTGISIEDIIKRSNQMSEIKKVYDHLRAFIMFSEDNDISTILHYPHLAEIISQDKKADLN